LIGQASTELTTTSAATSTTGDNFGYTIYKDHRCTGAATTSTAKAGTSKTAP
jgi:hypothetical protein